MKANKFIEQRDKLSADITKYWNIISIENVVNRNYQRTYDLKELYNTIKGLNSAEGYIRHALAKSINLRNTPEIRFILDQSIEYGVNMSKKIDEVIGQEES